MEEQKTNNNKESTNFIRVIIFLGLIIAVISLYFLFAVETPQKPLAGHGELNADNIPIGGSFELINHNGEKFSSDQLKGKPSLIYFGFTFCPDICPTSLQKLTEVMNVLDKYKIDVTPVFITIDPARDKADLLKDYLGHFHPKFIGLTGNPDQIKEVANKFKVYYARAESKVANNRNYMLDHSSFVYLMDKDGKYLKHFYMSSTAEEIIEFIRVNCRG